MLRLHYFQSRSEQKPLRYFFLCVIFFGLGFALAFSSVDLPPFVFIHEAGHSVTAWLLDVRLEKNNARSFFMYLEKDEPLRKYVRVLHAGYKAELLMWYAVMIVLFIVNVRRTRHCRNGFHFPIALVPGYAVGLFLKLKGTTDIQVISGLIGSAESIIIRRFVLAEMAVMLGALAAYIFGFFVYLLNREKKMRSLV